MPCLLLSVSSVNVENTVWDKIIGKSSLITGCWNADELQYCDHMLQPAGGLPVCMRIDRHLVYYNETYQHWGSLPGSHFSYSLTIKLGRVVETDPHRETDTDTERQICCNCGEFFNQVVSSEQLSCLCRCRPINPACRIDKKFKPWERWWLAVCPKVLGFQRPTNYLTETNTLPHFQWGWCQVCKQEGKVDWERDQLQEDETSECKLMHTCMGNWCRCWHKKQ